MSVRISRLANGLRVVTDTMDSVETVSLGVWVDVGTRHEPKEINGVAHVLEHMAFKGTSRRSALEIAAEIEAVGGHLNAYTSREHTAYYAKVMKPDVPLAVDILADILQHSTFEPAELERERAVILQEIGQAQDTPEDIIYDYLQEQAFPDQPMGRPVLGRAAIIRAIARDAVAGYLTRNYAAPGMVLAAAGNCDHDAVVALAEMEQRPHYQAAKSRPQGRGGDRPYFGSIPDFASDEPGYHLGGVSPDSPADKGGLKAGDAIVKLGEYKIGNLEDFDGALRKYKAGDKVPVVVKRDGEEVKSEVVLDPPR